MEIRRAEESDFLFMWPIFQAVVASETTYVFAADTPYQDAFDFFFGEGVRSFVSVNSGKIVGMYRMVTNKRDLGSHVANASFMVDPAFSGRGAGKQMGLHCLQQAREAGYLAIQFNFVVSTNEAAVALWKKLGFEIVGTLPKAFKHRELGYVDAYVMYQLLDKSI